MSRPSIVQRGRRTGLKLLPLGVAAWFVVPPAHAAEDSEASRAQPKAGQTPAVEMQVEPAPVLAQQEFLGKAPWICTPSGFGAQARCFTRASLQRRQ